MGIETVFFPPGSGLPGAVHSDYVMTRRKEDEIVVEDLVYLNRLAASASKRVSWDIESGGVIGVCSEFVGTRGWG